MLLNLMCPWLSNPGENAVFKVLENFNCVWYILKKKLYIGGEVQSHVLQPSDHMHAITVGLYKVERQK